MATAIRARFGSWMRPVAGKAPVRKAVVQSFEHGARRGAAHWPERSHTVAHTPEGHDLRLIDVSGRVLPVGKTAKSSAIRPA